jgi:Leucine-rich repeat (LRR) protein
MNLTSYPKLRYIYVSHNKLINAPEVTDKNQIKTMSLDNNNIKKL